MKDRIREAKEDRDRLQRDFDNIMRQPFFRKEGDTENMKSLENLQGKLESREEEVHKSQGIIKRNTQELNKTI